MATKTYLQCDWLSTACILCVLFISLLQVTYAATIAEERSSQKVKIKLYGLSTSDWSQNKKNSFSSVIADEATTYCSNSPSSCGLNSGVLFSPIEVGMLSAEKTGSSIEFTFYIDYPAGATVDPSGATAHVVPMAAVQAISAAGRSEVRSQVGYYITYIEEDYYSIPPDTETNSIIVPIAFVTVFVLAVSVVIMKYYVKRKDRQEVIQQRLARKKQNKVGQHDMSYNAMETTTTTILTTNNINTTPRPDLVSNNTYKSPKKFSTKESEARNESKENVDKPVVLVKKQNVAKIYPSGMNQFYQNNVNDFHSGAFEDEEVDEDEEKSYNNGHVQSKTRLVSDDHQHHQQELLQQQSSMDVAQSLAEDEAKRERKRRRKEKKRERKRREEDEGNELDVLRQPQRYDYENQGYDVV